MRPHNIRRRSRTLRSTLREAAVSGRVAADTQIRRAVESKARRWFADRAWGAQRFRLRAPRHGSKSEVV